MAVPQDAVYIDGRWCSTQDRASIPTVDPATEEAITTCAAGGPGDIAKAVSAARSAFDQRWRKTPAHERADYLLAIAGAVRSRAAELAEIEVRDNGKPLPEAAWDIEDAAGCFEYYAALAREFPASQEQPIALPDDRFRSVVRREPIGVAGQIIPWNYPLLMAAWKVAPALAAGCTCVLKPSELTPLTALELADIAHGVGLPAGVLNVVTGTGADAGAALVSHPAVDKIAFTGSVATGAHVMASAAPNIKKVGLELGGKSPIIVFADTDIDQAVEWIMFGIFWNQGQVCSATSRLLVERAFAPDLLDALATAASRIRIGNGLSPGVQLGPLVSRGQKDKVIRHIEGAKAEGARLVCGGSTPRDLPRGYFVEPTILDRVTPAMRIWQEEVFGPVLGVTCFDTEPEAVRLANATDFGLGAAVMSGDPERSRRIARELKAGVVWVDCSQPTFVQAPWGGMKRSGVGRELGPWGMEGYLDVKQITSYESKQPWGWYRKG